MQHVPSISTILVDVERIALDSMLSHLQELNLAYQVLLNPSNLECKRYLTNDMILIIRPLISEAPLESNDGITVPSLEKILVDAAGELSKGNYDVELESEWEDDEIGLLTDAFSSMAVSI